jgi:DNA-binding winged helix-turn-helix (wHTH) protein/tetratricopeptide (TPR) repeat protein
MTNDEKKHAESEVYRFGDRVLDADRRELRAAGEVVTTQPKVFSLLLYLVRNRSRAVDKDEIQDAIWPRSIVTETALTRAVMKARRAVGDDAERQEIIRTVHGHGYRFVAELAKEPAATEEKPAVDIPATSATHKASRLRPIAIAVLVLVAVAVAWWYLAPTAYSGPVRIAVLPVENATGDDELEWTRTGLMALIIRMLEDQEIPTVGSRSVSDLAGDQPIGQLIANDSEFRRVLEKTTAATHILATRLEFDGGLYRLTYSISDGEQRPQRRTVVGQEPAGLVKQLVETTTALMGNPRLPQDRMSFISDDDFINETYARAMSLEFEGRYEEAQRMFQVIIDQEPQSFWPRYEYAICARNLRDYAAAEQMFVELRTQTTANAGLNQLAAVKNALGILLYSQNRNDEAQAELEDVVRIAAEIGDLDYAGIAHQNLGLVAKRRGDINTAYDHMMQSLASYEAQDIDTLPGTLQNNLAGVLIQLGDLEQAEQYSLGAVEYFRLTGKRLFESYALSRLSTIYRRLGALDEAEATQLSAKAIREELGDESGIAGSLISLSAIAESRGDLTRSRQFAQEAYDIGIEIDNRDVAIGALQRMAKAELLLGRARQADARYSEAEALSVATGDRVSEFSSRHGKARAWIRLGDYDGAESVAAELLQTARENQMERHEAGAIALQAELQMAREQWPQAIALLEESAAITERIGDTALRDATYQHIAEACLALDNVEDARRYVALIEETRADDPQVMVLQARLAAIDGDAGEAVRIMAAARSSAGEAWDDDQQALLESLRAVASQTATDQD